MRWLIAGLIFMIIAALFVVPNQISAQDDIPSDQIREIAWSPDGSRIAAAYQDGEIRIADVSTGVVTLTVQGIKAPVFSPVWSPDGLLLAASADNDLQIWNTISGRLTVEVQDVGDDILGIGWKPDGSQIIAVAAEGFTDSSNAVVVATADWRAIPINFALSGDFEWNPAGNRLATVSLFSARVFDAVTYEPLQEFAIERERFRDGLLDQLIRIQWSPDGAHLAGGTGDGRVFVWRLDDPQALFRLAAHDYEGTERLIGRVYALHFDSTGHILTSVSGDGTIRSWDIRTGDRIGDIKTVDNYAAAFSPDGKQIALGLSPEARANSYSLTANERRLTDVDVIIDALAPITVND
jgi:WD40 repeat protein